VGADVPPARYLFSRTEYAWLESIHAAAPVEGPGAALAATFADSVLPIVDAGLADLVDVPGTVVEGVELVALPGHTAGHLVAEITGGGATALVTGDVLHHPLQFTDLTLAQAGDADPHLAALSRRTLCDRAADAGAVVLPAHFGGPDGGRITRAGHGFRYADR
jgi:glyoxylase-like metal-dependent hydrolase (beta-lactamase superfamily II)